MDKRTFLKNLAALAVAPSVTGLAQAHPAPAADAAEWSLSMDVLESCSCPVFCQCFFTGKPPASAGAHEGHVQHVCRFNQVYRVTAGHAGRVRLDGVRFWFLGDAGDDFAKAKLDWAVLTFDPNVSAEQRDALLGILRHLRWYRSERWTSYAVGDDAAIEWSADKDGAHATLGNRGSIAEVQLRTMRGLHDAPVLIANLEYFGFPRNGGFTLMPADLVAYRRGSRAFEYKGTNGLLTTVDMNARDFPA